MSRQSNQILKKLVKSSWENSQIPIPNVFLRYYKKLGLNEQEAMFILHIINFQKLENQPFPAIDSIGNRMAIEDGQIMGIIKRLITSGYLKIEDSYDEVMDMHAEVYNTEPLIDQLTEMWLKEEGWLEKINQLNREKPKEALSTKTSLEHLIDFEKADVFTIFEAEFGRPLSPIECEKIIKWIQDDQFSKYLIVEALRQAVLVNKYSMQYIDRILFEWKKKNIRTKQDVLQANLEYQEKKRSYSKNQTKDSKIISKHSERDKELWFWLDIDSQEGR